MSQENVDVIRRIYAVWQQEGSPAPSGLLDPEIEWANPPDAIEPGVDIDEMLDAGDRVVVLATLHGRLRQGYVWTLRDGKVIRFEWFNSPDDAMMAAGVHC